MSEWISWWVVSVDDRWNRFPHTGQQKIRSWTHTHTHTQTHLRIKTSTSAHTHTHTHTNTRIEARMHAHKHTHTYRDTHAETQKQTQTDRQTHKETHTQTHACTHTDPHTHTYNDINIDRPAWILFHYSQWTLLIGLKEMYKRMVHNLFSSAGCHWPTIWGVLKPPASYGVNWGVRQADSPAPDGPELRQGLETQSKQLRTPGSAIPDY